MKKEAYEPVCYYQEEQLAYNCATSQNNHSWQFILRQGHKSIIPLLSSL